MLSHLRKDIKGSIAHLYSSGVDLSGLGFLYDLSWKALQSCPYGDAKIWTRNSYYFKSFIPGISDIDVSVLSENKPRELVIWKNLLKLPFPWLGEINWYPQAIFRDMCFLANKIELSRDPDLLLETGTLPDATDTEKFIFLVRMISYDLSGLKLNPSARIRKWAYHWDLVRGKHETERESFCRELSLEKALNLAMQFVPADKKAATWIALQEAFIEEKRVDWLMPHKYHNLYDFDFLSCESVFPEATQAQINWEFWGVCTQAYWLPKVLFFEHLVKLNKIPYSAISPEAASSRRNIITYVEKHF